MKFRQHFVLIFLPLLIFLTSATTLSVAQTNEVVVNVAVLNEKGMPVNGLGFDDFQISVDKVPQKIVNFQKNGGPSSIGIVIDDSASMFKGAKLEKLRARLIDGFEEFVKVGNESNEYFTMLFNSKASRFDNWSKDPSVISTALANTTSEGQTPLYDALSQAIKKVSSGNHQQHVLIVITDGQDSTSKLSFNKLRDELKDSDVILYAVGVLSGSDAGSSLGMEGQGVLDELTSMTGGRAYFPHQDRDKEYASVVAAIGADLMSQYQLVFIPDPMRKKKEWHEIKTKVSVPADLKKKIVVRARQAFH